MHRILLADGFLAQSTLGTLVPHTDTNDNGSTNAARGRLCSGAGLHVRMEILRAQLALVSRQRCKELPCGIIGSGLRRWGSHRLALTRGGDGQSSIGVVARTRTSTTGRRR